MRHAYRYGMCVINLLDNGSEGWIISGVDTKRGFRNLGHAEECMKLVTGEADKEGVRLRLSVHPDDDIDELRLRKFYERHRFVDDPEFIHGMIREPVHE
jgi:ribosomal protein S18 acetylase RimI-like enzyme